MRERLQADRLSVGQAKVRRDGLLARTEHASVGLQALLSRLLHLRISGLRMSMTLKESHNLMSRNLLPESLLNATTREHTVQHIIEFASRLHDLLEDLAVQLAFGVCEHLEVVLDYNKLFLFGAREAR